jgi:26S proteasome regulatory subunit (ATPase 3-interacting protein)
LLGNVAALEAEKAEITARLDSLKAGKAKKVTKEQREEVEKEWKKMGRVAKKREKIAKGMWEYIVDQGLEKEQREELREALGLDD